MPLVVIGLIILWVLFGPMSDSCPLPQKIQCPVSGECIVTSEYSRWRWHKRTGKFRPPQGL